MAFPHTEGCGNAPFQKYQALIKSKSYNSGILHVFQAFKIVVSDVTCNHKLIKME